MIERNNGILKFADRAGRHGKPDPVVKAGRVKGRRSTPRITHAKNIFRVYGIRKIFFRNVDRSLYVPDALSDRRSAEKQSGQRRVSSCAKRSAVIQTSARPHVPLLKDQCRIPLFQSLQGKITSACDQAVIASEFRLSAGNMHSR